MISSEEVLSVTGNVFCTMLESNVVLTDDHVNLADHEPMTGCVHITGQWSGAVMIQTTGALAKQTASTMLAIDEEEVELVDCQDAMAEIANMIGGNIKSLCPGNGVLSLPTVTSGKEYDIKIFGTEVENATDMDCGGEYLRVVVCRAKG